MALLSASTQRHPLGLSAGPEQSVIVGSFASGVVTGINLDATSNVEFYVIGPCEVVEAVIVSGTAKTGTPSVVWSLQGFDEGSQTWITLVSSAAMTDASSDYLLVSHHATAVANHSVQRVVRERMRILATVTGTPVTDVLNNVTVTIQAEG